MHRRPAPLPAPQHAARRTAVRLGAAALLGIALSACGAASAGSAPRTPPAPVHSTVPAATTVRTTTASFRLPATVSRAVAVSPAPGRLEVLGGLHDGERSTGAVVRIDLASGAVQVVGRLPVAVHDAAGGLLAGVPTVLGGGNSAEVSTIQQVTGSGAAVAGQLPAPTSDAVAVGTTRGLLLVGGYDGTHTLGQVLLVAAPGRIVHLGSLTVPVRYPAVSVVGSGAGQRVLVIGGESGGVATDVVQQVDPATGAVSVVGHLPAPRTQASALFLGGTVFVFGGASSGSSGASVFSDVLRWEPATRTFAAAGSLPYPVADAAFVSPDGKTGYLIGGESPSRVDTTIVVRVQ